jgi:hypothetical protein
MDIRLRSVRLIVAAVIAVCVTRCTGGRISDSIGATVAQGAGARLAIAEHGPSSWEKVCVFGPYTSDEQVDAVTGIRGAAKRAYDIRSSDGINVLMFIERGQVIESVAHPRRHGDFGPELVRKCYLKEEAVFIVREPPTGSWGNIGPIS